MIAGRRRAARLRFCGRSRECGRSNTTTDTHRRTPCWLNAAPTRRPAARRRRRWTWRCVGSRRLSVGVPRASHCPGGCPLHPQFAPAAPSRPCRCSQNVLGIILGGGAGTRLYPLTKKRAKPAVPLVRRARQPVYLLSTTLAPCGRPPCAPRCYVRTPGVVAVGFHEPLVGRCGGAPGWQWPGHPLSLSVSPCSPSPPWPCHAGVQLPPD
jgi:hypothetical protein